jgi:hypothetical protein
VELELERIKAKSLQREDGFASLSMHAMAKALKALQTIMVSQREHNAKLTLALEEAKKIRGWPKWRSCEDHEDLNFKKIKCK